MLAEAVALMNSAKLADPSGVRMATQPDELVNLATDYIPGTAVPSLSRIKDTLGPITFSRQTAADGERTLFLGAGEGNAIIAAWGNPELIVDPFSESKTGHIALTIFGFADVVVRRLATHFYALHSGE